MINDMPKVIYDKNNNPMRVVKVTTVFFEKYKRKGYVFHVEREERITSISEFEVIEDKGKFRVTREILKNCEEI